MSATYSLKAAALQVLERNRTRNTSARTTKDLQDNEPRDTCGLLRENSLDRVSLETMKLPDRDSVPGVADVSRIASWLNYIGEQDPIIVAEVFEKCREDPEALRYFLMQSNEAPADFTSDEAADDRISCCSCTNLADDGRCLAAARGQIVGATRTYHPVPERLRRCEAYRPEAIELDQRPGWTRWPSLLDQA